MKKIDWSYDKKFKRYEYGFPIEYNQYTFEISPDNYKRFTLMAWTGSDRCYMTFKKLSTAKKVAELIFNG